MLSVFSIHACTLTLFNNASHRTLGAAGIPQLSLALEAFNDARAACYLAVSVMERKTEVAGEGPKTSQVACSALSASLPKYEIDSSSTGGVSASSLNVSEIRFEDVSFSYPSRPSSLILENFSLSIKKGSTIGIVGPSGSGVRGNSMFQYGLP